jgi:hypothetical protein
MSFRMLGSRIEYLQASKRLEELAHARPGTPQAQERKELIDLFREFEKEIKEVKATPLEKSKNKKKKIELYYSRLSFSPDFSDPEIYFVNRNFILSLLFNSTRLSLAGVRFPKLNLIFLVINSG